MTKVLVVDDSWVARLGISKLLKGLDCEVIEAGDGLQAVQVIVDSSPDLVFLDLLMPELDGFGVLERLAEKGIRVPVYVLSADIQETTRRKCLDLGALDCLAKPPTRESIEVCIKALT